MKTICILNLKGGVAKTITAINMAYILSANHGKKVLLVDCDKQGNTTKFFGLHSYEEPSISDVLTSKGFDIQKAIRPAAVAVGMLDILPANMSLLHADREVLMDVTRPQQTRLRSALTTVSDAYDYCVIDNAPDLSMSVINALAAADDVIIPIKIDRFAFDGLDILLEQIDAMTEFNRNLKVAGGLITMAARNGVNTQGTEILQARSDIRMFKTVIRRTVSVDESTFSGIPLTLYAKKSTASQDYCRFVEEYLKLS